MLTSLVALAQPYVRSSTIVLGLCSILLNTLAYTLLEDVILNLENTDSEAVNGNVRGDVTSAQRAPSSSAARFNIVIFNLSAIIALGCAATSILLEKHPLDALAQPNQLPGMVGERWKKDIRRLDYGQGVTMGLLGACEGLLAVYTVSRNTST